MMAVRPVAICLFATGQIHAVDAASVTAHFVHVLPISEGLAGEAVAIGRRENKDAGSV
jgi:hypothetical protein